MLQLVLVETLVVLRMALSCQRAAYSGFIGYINHGCRGVDSCPIAAYNRSIGGISYACNNYKSCFYLASNYCGIGYSSVNSAVVSCCNDDSECTGSIVDVSTGSIVDVSGLPSGLPVTCEGIVASPTSSPTTAEVRILFHALYNMFYVQFINL